jgi:nitronate monooxygenase
MPKSEPVRDLGLRTPVIQAPMGGGPSTPELVAAVSNAGGLGSLAAAYLTPAEIHGAIRRIRALTSRPFAVNLFSGGYATGTAIDSAPMLSLLAEAHAELGLQPPVLPTLPADPFPDLLAAVLEGEPPVFSFTFGIPGVEAMKVLKQRGIQVWGTATTAAEAAMLAQAGVDAVIAQGAEAGAHRGTFAVAFEAAMVPTLQLVESIANAVDLPVIASGGIMSGRDIAATLRRGACAAALGTAFLPCPESGAAEAYKRAILAAGSDKTVITRAFSGRPARGLANGFIAKLRAHEHLILPYPLQNALTRAMRTAAAKQGNPDFLSLWAGTGVGRARAIPAAELTRRLDEEARADLETSGPANARY